MTAVGRSAVDQLLSAAADRLVYTAGTLFRDKRLSWLNLADVILRKGGETRRFSCR